MARLRFMAAALLALSFAGSSIQTGRTQTASPNGWNSPTTSAGFQTPGIKPPADDPCTIYSLAEMGCDADLGKWIAQTVPEMIEPSSWKGQGGTGAVRYYAPKNILIVKQTKAIQKKVDGFLKDLKASMPEASTAGKRTPHAPATLADYREPALLRTSNPASEVSSYPVPAAVKPPKHLFHFIIRYEGDGIIDDNVVKFIKAQLQGGKPLANLCPHSPSPVALPAPPAVTPPGVTGAPAINVAPGYPQPSSPGYTAPPYMDSSNSVPPAPEPPSPAPNKKKGKHSTVVAPAAQ
jgi:hypothetical protein